LGIDAPAVARELWVRMHPLRLAPDKIESRDARIAGR
jgi:hypothetical protein